MFKKWSVPVRRLQRSPQIRLPPDSVINFYLGDQDFTVFFSNGNGQSFNAMGSHYITPVAVALFIEMLMFFQYDFLAGKEGAEVLKTWEEVEVDEDAGHWILVAGHW